MGTKHNVFVKLGDETGRCTKDCECRAEYSITQPLKHVEAGLDDSQSWDCGWRGGTAIRCHTLETELSILRKGNTHFYRALALTLCNQF